MKGGNGAGDEKVRLAFVLDLDRCVGCWACAVACKMENDLPDGVWWVHVETVGGAGRDTSAGVFPDVRKHYMPVIDQCVYTPAQLATGQPPACARACPVDVIQIGNLNDEGDPVASAVASGMTFTVAQAEPRAPHVHYVRVRTPSRQRRSGHLGS
jgi:Fe-S-cluster-containing dehydrogenase component